VHGRASFHRTDAYILADCTHLTITPTVVQSNERGITLSLSSGQTWNGQLAVSLSDDIVLPFSTEKRLALLTMPSSAKVLTPADFSGARSRDEGLPVTRFEVETDGNGIQTVYLVARPVIYATDPDQNNVNYLTETVSRMDGETEVFMWSDHQKAHGGADYVLGNGAYVRSAAGWEDRRIFPGESLEMSNGSRITLKTKMMYFTNLMMHGGTRLMTGGCAGGATPHRICGRVRFIDSSEWQRHEQHIQRDGRIHQGREYEQLRETYPCVFRRGGNCGRYCAGRFGRRRVRPFRAWRGHVQGKWHDQGAP